MLVVYDTCKQFQKLIPMLCVDELNVEMLADRQVDHCFDESCHICMARPQGIPYSDIEEAKEKLARKKALASLDSVSRTATAEFEETLEESTRDPFYD